MPGSLALNFRAIPYIRCVLCPIDSRSIPGGMLPGHCWCRHPLCLSGNCVQAPQALSWSLRPVLEAIQKAICSFSMWIEVPLSFFLEEFLPLVTVISMFTGVAYCIYLLLSRFNNRISKGYSRQVRGNECPQHQGLLCDTGHACTRTRSGISQALLVCAFLALHSAKCHAQGLALVLQLLLTFHEFVARDLSHLVRCSGTSVSKEGPASLARRPGGRQGAR